MSPSARGLRDYQDELAERIAPGSLRAPPPHMAEGVPYIGGGPAGAAGMPPSGLVEALIAAFQILRGISQEPISRGGVPTVEAPANVWQVNAYVVGAVNAILIDEPLRRSRRMVTVTNCSLANDLWLGPDSMTRVNFGECLGPRQARSYPFSEQVRIYAVASAAGTVASVTQVAS